MARSPWFENVAMDFHQEPAMQNIQNNVFYMNWRYTQKTLKGQ